MATVEGKKITELTQKASINSTDRVMVLDGEDAKLIEAGLLQGASNMTDEYVILKDDKEVEYRVFVGADGKLRAIKNSVFNVSLPSNSDNKNYKGLLINSMYGGGNALSSTPVSHSFIELYNLTKQDISLEGLYLWYKDANTSWTSLELHGVIPSYSSFLVVGYKHNDYFNDECRIKIKEYDMVWNDSNGVGMKFSDKGFVAYLCVGGETPIDFPVYSITDPVSGGVTIQERFIDMLAVGGKEEGQAPPCYQGNYRSGASNKVGVRRVDFGNAYKATDMSGYANGYGNNYQDTVLVDFTQCEVAKERPCSVNDGQWDMFRYARSFNWDGINCFVLGYGQEGESSRTFTFQTRVTEEAWVWYRKQGSNKWIKVKCDSNKYYQHVDCTASVHRAIIRDLEAGIYEYKVGFQGVWSDIEEFEVKTYDLEAGDEIKILWTSDEQSWNLEEANTFRNVFNKIQEWEKDTNKVGNVNYDFHLNTGDITQNGKRREEMFLWNEHLNHVNYNVPLMACVGNNDLRAKKYSSNFQNYFTNENPKWNGFYHYFLGDVCFISVNSNQDYEYVDNGDFANTDAFLQAEANALDELITNLKEDSSRPLRWIIVYMHQSCFTNVRTKRMQKFVPVIEKHKIPLVCCGHQHIYARSKALYTRYDGVSEYNTYYDFNNKATTPYVDEASQTNIDGEIGINHNEDLANGTHYVSVNATGWKCTGKEKKISLYPTNAQAGYDYDESTKLPWWMSKIDATILPMYTTMTINKDKIHLQMWQVSNAFKHISVNNSSYQYTPNYEDVKDSMSKTLIDELIINLSDRL